jgi:hypothetical protein
MKNVVNLEQKNAKFLKIGNKLPTLYNTASELNQSNIVKGYGKL